MLTRAQKQQQIEVLREALTPAQGLFVMEYIGLTVGEVTELRRKIKAANGNYLVVKNTLTRIALRDSTKAPVQQLISGPIAVAYTSHDSVMLAKAIAEFAKSHEKLRFRGGLVDGSMLDAAQAQQVATLPSKPELVSRLLYVLQSPMRRLAVALAWPTRSLAVTLKQVADARTEQA